MTRKNDIEGARKAIQYQINSFKMLNPSHLKKFPLYLLDVIALAERVGKITKGSRVYYICEKPDELKALIAKATSCFYSYEALKIIYTHHYEAVIPYPESLHEFVLECMNGEVKKPSAPKDLYEQMLDMLIPQLVSEGKKYDATMEAIYNIISDSLNGEAGSPDAVRKRYQKLKTQ